MHREDKTLLDAVIRQILFNQATIRNFALIPVVYKTDLRGVPQSFLVSICGEPSCI